MGYEAALSKAWVELGNITKDKNFSVHFLNDRYNIDLKNKKILSLSCNVVAKDYLTILLLHYLVQKLKGLSLVAEEWISFQQLAGGEGYYPAFKKRVIEPIVKKYGSKPDAIYGLVGRFKAKKIQLADVSVVLEAFENVPILITLSKADEEFDPEANVLFDKSIKNIFCTEDIVVLAGFVAYRI